MARRVNDRKSDYKPRYHKIKVMTMAVMMITDLVVAVIMITIIIVIVIIAVVLTTTRTAATIVEYAPTIDESPRIMSLPENAAK